MDGWGDIAAQLDAFSDREPNTLIDVACGTGRVITRLHIDGWIVTSHDICGNCFAPEVFEFANEVLVCPVTDLANHEPCDLAMCIDFLEHVPEEILDDVLAAIAHVGRLGAVLGISTFQDSGGLHVTVKDADWWEQQLARFWPQVERCDVTVRLANQNRLNWLLFRCEK